MDTNKTERNEAICKLLEALTTDKMEDVKFYIKLAIKWLL